jgi:hypothetical protein
MLKNNYLRRIEINLNSIVTFISIAVAIVLTTIPQLKSNMPIGGDTLIYAGWVDLSTIKDPTWILLNLDRPLFILLLCTIKNLLGVASLSLMKVVPPILTLIYIISIYFFSKELPKEDVSPAFAAMLAALSTTTLRFAIDLYSNFFALSLMIFFFTMYLKSQTFTELIYVLPLFPILILMSHFATFILLNVILTIYIILIFIFKREATFRVVYFRNSSLNYLRIS